MTANVSPSLRAVKKAEPNMAIPAKIKEKAHHQPYLSHLQ